MTRCSVFIATSLDGFIARRDGAIDWLSIVEVFGEDYGYAAFFATVDAIVLGRGTYDVVREFPAWPYGDTRVVVWTHRPIEARHGEIACAGTPADLVASLGDARRIYIDGGKTIQQFLAAGLVDDVTVSILPILLGDGLPLFGALPAEQRLELLAHRAWPTGLVQVEYAIARPARL